MLTPLALAALVLPAHAGDLIGIDTTIKVKKGLESVVLDDETQVEGAALTVQGGDLRVEGSAGLSVAGGDLTVRGGDLDLSGAALVVSGSTVAVDAEAAEGSVTVNGGDLTLGDSSVLVMESASLVVNGGSIVLTDDSTVLMMDGSDLAVAGGSLPSLPLASCDSSGCLGPELPADVGVLSQGSDVWLVRVEGGAAALSPQAWPGLLLGAVTAAEASPREAAAGMAVSGLAVPVGIVAVRSTGTDAERLTAALDLLGPVVTTTGGTKQ